MLILIDFDGTLADTSLGIYKAFEEACLRCNLCSPTYKELSSKIGPPISVIAKDIHPHLTKAQLANFTAFFRHSYDNHWFRTLSWYPLVPETLHVLKNSGHDLSIVTNKPSVPTKQLIHESMLDAYFDFIIGIDYLKYHTNGRLFESKSKALSFAISSYHYSLQSVVYIGDTESDYEATKNTNISFIHVLYGYGSMKNSNSPFHQVSNFCDILNIFS